MRSKINIYEFFGTGNEKHVEGPFPDWASADRFKRELERVEPNSRFKARDDARTRRKSA